MLDSAHNLRRWEEKQKVGLQTRNQPITGEMIPR